jgi:hypothetical protein
MADHGIARLEQEFTIRIIAATQMARRLIVAGSGKRFQIF